jgi:transcriptional regulator with XRE-family HTH domain
MANDTNATVAQQELLRLLKELRDEAGLTAAQVAERMEWSESKISRIERGLNGLHPLAAKELCTLYGRPDMIEPLQTLARAAKIKSWWQGYGDVIPSGFNVYLGLEQAAESIDWYETDLVPGILQTENYARELIRADNPDDDDVEIDRRVQVRLKRQALLTREVNPQRWHFIISESLLHRPIGPVELMTEQLNHLLEVAELPNVVLSVVPFSAGLHPGILSGAFVLLEFPTNGKIRSQQPTTVYVDAYTGALATTEKDEVTRYRKAFDGITKAALTPADSIAYIKKAIKEMTA